MSFVKNAAAGAILGGALLVPAGLGVAGAQPAQAPDGLVNIAVGDVTILQNVPAEAAAHTAGALCGTSPAEVGKLAQRVDSDGASATVCEGLPGGDLIITQNAATSQGGTSQGGTSQGGTSQGGTSQDGTSQDGTSQDGTSQDGTDGAHSSGAAESASPSDGG